jgi:threonine aldolase
MKRIDLRSDTVTVPTPEMRRAMSEAEVGDDVYGEDPTIRQLEEEAARVLGKEAALFLASGTQANQVAVLTHARRGEEVVVEAESHVFYYEVGGIAALAGCQVWPVRGERGAMDPERVEAAIRPRNIHFPRTALVCVEDTHNRAGGAVLPPGNLAAVAAVAHRYEVPVHLDGARIFNAAIARGKPVSELAAAADSVMFCLSKGLGAPVGSMLAGNRGFIDRARVNRKLLGGGMRQAGILGAAGLVALRTMVERLAEDHANAQGLARGLREIEGLAVDGASVETNIVLFDVVEPRWDAALLARRLADKGLLCNATGTRQIRMVTHKDVGRADVEEALDRVRSTLRTG